MTRTGGLAEAERPTRTVSDLEYSLLNQSAVELTVLHLQGKALVGVIDRVLETKLAKLISSD